MRRVVAGVGVLLLAVPLLGVGPAVGAGRPYVSVPGATVTGAGTAGAVEVAAAAALTVAGRGFGHGRGMGQYGALGYAVDGGWSSAQVLDHYYGGTRAGLVPDLPVGVELVSLRGRTVPFTGPGLALDGVAVGHVAVLVERSGAGTLRLRTGPGCTGPWTEAGTRPAGVTLTSEAGAVGVCETGLVRGYRGNVHVTEASSRLVAVNQLHVEQYLRGVVPRESSASWASLGGGRGAQALQAQAVAARSYALSTAYSSYATTCDTTACQVYGGAWTRSQATGVTTSTEDGRTDAAIAATAGLVRRTSGGAVARTEFSSSTGGWTAGGQFPAVQDLGDATASNPNTNWSTSFSLVDLAARLGTGPVDDIVVTRRNGLGAEGGRVLEVLVVSGSVRRTFTGNEVRQRLGLKSDWFSFTGYVSATVARALAQSMYADLLGRRTSADELAFRTDQLRAGTPTSSVGLDVAGSQERAQALVAVVYRDVLGREPGGGEIQGWVSQLQAQGSVAAVQAAVLASEEAWLRAGDDPRTWVDHMYRSVLLRPASGLEQDFWAEQARQRGRAAVAQDVAGSTEAAGHRLAGYYARLLGRAPDPGAQVHLSRLVGFSGGDLTVPTALVGSPEYLSRSVARYP